MRVKFISNEYIFKNSDKDMLTVIMRNIESVATVEFHLNNKMMYYYIISEDKIQGLNDLDIINEAVSYMKEDKQRWIVDCQYYLNNCEKFILNERVTVYEAILDSNSNHVCTINIVEENDNRFKISMYDAQLNTMVVTHMNAENRNMLIESMEALYSMILEMIKPFKNKEEQIILNEFGKDYVLQRQLDKLHN